MAMPPASHRVVRVFTTVITAAIWWFILYGAGYVFSGGSKVAHVLPVVMANLTAMTFVFIPYFVTQSVLVGMLDSHIKQRVIVSETEDPSARAENPWRPSVMNALRFGLAAAVLGYVLSMRAGPDSLTPGAFAMRYAWGGALLCAVVAWLVGGEPFLKSMRVPRDKRMFQGDPKAYLASRFVWPHGIANGIINAALAFALSPVSIAEAGAIVPAPVVVGDAVITFFILTWLMVSGVKTHSRVEAQWGIAPEAAAADLNVPAAFLPAFFLSVGFSICVGVSFWLLKSPGLNVYAWALFRGVVFGVYSAWLSKRVAQAMLNETFHPEAAITTAPIANANRPR